MTTPRVSFTRFRHLLSPLGSPDDNYLSAIAKIQGSSMMICTDAHMRRLYLYDILRPYKGLGYEVEGYHMNDLAISSVSLLDGDDGQAVCGDICVNEAGHSIFALILSLDNRGAWIKVYQLLNRQISYTGLRFRVPDNRTPLSIIMNETFELSKLGPTTHLGLPFPYNPMCYGSGIEIMNGVLYVLTRRKVHGELITRVRYDMAMSPTQIKLTPEEAKLKPGEEPTRGGANLYRLRLYEKRSAELQFSLLSALNANTGDNIGNYYLSYPGTTKDHEDDAVFHGLCYTDGRLYTCIRYDKALVPQDLGQWHLEEARWHSLAPEYEWVVRWGTDKDGNEKLEEGYATGQVLGFIKHQYALGDEDKPISVPSYGWVTTDRVGCTKAVMEFQKRVKQISQASAELPTPIFQTRGQTVLVRIEEPVLQSYPEKDRLPLLKYTIENNHYPFGVSMPYSMTADRNERKLYGVYGNQIWVFDLLDYTILTRHKAEDPPKIFEGDIIDFGDILEQNRSELQCFIRNDSYRKMLNVILTIELTDDPKDQRREDVFLNHVQGGVGYKILELGDIDVGESRGFWVSVHPLNVQAWEDKTTYSLPLRVKYEEDVDTEP